MALASVIPGEEYFKVAIGQGMYTAELASNIPDGYSAICYNMVAAGDSLENRSGIRRSSVDWKVFDHPAGGPNPDTEKINIIYMLNNNISDSSLPSFAWGSGGYVVPSQVLTGSGSLNLVRSAGVAAAGDGFMSIALPNTCLGISQYLDRVYFVIHGQGVHYISNLNWAADSITYTAVPSSANGTFHGLFTFKDRMWAYQDDLLYFTDVATLGGYPETWAFAVNRIPFRGIGGKGRIKKVIPIGNKLVVFTSSGLFTLLVEGAPQSWILRSLDSESISTTSQCAFESKNIIYYVNTQGVWATNGLACTKLSAVIEDQWFLAKGSRTHTINSYEDGMIVSIGKLCTGNLYVYDGPACRTFYSKLDPIGWTEWNLGQWSDPKATSPVVRNRLAQVQSTSKKVPTYLNPDPTVYMLAYITNCQQDKPDDWDYPVLQLLIFDGGKDQFVNGLNVVEEYPTTVKLKTKYIDGGNAYNLKQCKRGLLEIYTSDTEHKFETSWDIDASSGAGTNVRITANQDYTVGVGSNLVQIPSNFHYRRCALDFQADLQSDTSTIKIKDIALVQNTERAEFEKVR